MKIQIASDIHLEFEPFDLPETDADVIVLAGDIGTGTMGVEWAGTLGKPVVLVPGNHEYYNQRWDTHDTVMQLAGLATDNVDVLISSAVVHGGVRFLGTTLWTDFRLYGESSEMESMMYAKKNMNDYKLIKTSTGRHAINPFYTKTAHDVAVAWLKIELARPFDGKTVVVTHHAPTSQMLNPHFWKKKNDALSPAYASNLDYLINPPINLWVSGHTHHSTIQMVNNVACVSNCRGYPLSVSDRSIDDQFNSSLVIDI